MKIISVVIPCYNDSNSVKDLHLRIVSVFCNELSNYDYSITFVDDCSPDGGKTWEEIESVCRQDNKVRGVQNASNLGFCRNQFASMLHGEGDATVMLFGDAQEPPEVLPQLVRLWEEGSLVALGVRTNQHNGFIISVARKAYYFIIKKLSGNKMIIGANGFGIYDKSFTDILSEIEDTQPFVVGIAREYVRDIKLIDVWQEKGGRDGKTNLNFWGRYDVAMVSITSYTKYLLRIITFIGAAIGTLSILVATVIFVLRLVYPDAIPHGIPTLAVGIFFLGGVQLFFLGVMSEYILAINNRSMRRPVSLVQKKIGFAPKT